MNHCLLPKTCGLGPQCPLLAPKSSVDPLTHADLHTEEEKQELTRNVNVHLNITLTPFGVSISDKVRKHEAFMYSSAFILVFFPPCFHFLSPFLQVHRYIGAEVS